MHPVLFHIPFTNIPIYSYGVMLGTAIIVGWNLAMWIGKDSGIPARALSNGIFATVLLALVGSRVLYILTNWSRFHSPLEWFSVRDGGLVAYGGFIGGALGAYLFFVRKKVAFLKVADIMAPCVALGTSITRIGCFLYGCDYGKPTTLPWGIRFPRDSFYDRTLNVWKPSPAWEMHHADGLVGSDATWSLPVHPTQFYESLTNLLLFGALMLMRKKKAFDGQIFLAWFIFYGVTRALNEILRGDDQRGAVSVLSTSQFIGIVTAVAGIGAWWLLRKRGIGPALLPGSPLLAMAGAEGGSDGGGGGGAGGVRDDTPRPKAKAGRAGGKKKRK
ncbi:MAG TPA: prolipoprotein diacylglyceryl transferase [Myxococcota bacterium]|jgi:phosphatidylglycerol:prolipoprotein diacylglycerol transferase|nr:prolipoprotein diacylglyceryl transferase [Myxococcota bacterium]